MAKVVFFLKPPKGHVQHNKKTAIEKNAKANDSSCKKKKMPYELRNFAHQLLKRLMSKIGNSKF